MSYRDDVEAQRTRCDTLERELAELRTRARELAGLKAAEPEKARELAVARAMLHALGGKRPLPLLDALRIASPCKASWDDMVGDERVRFCGQCAKNVYNVSTMPRAEAEALLQEKAGDLCVRMVQRADGTVMSADCPVGAKKKRVRRAAAGVVSAGMMAAGAMLASRSAGTGRMGEAVRTVPVDMPVAMGSVSAPPDVTPPPRVGTDVRMTGKPMMGRAPAPRRIQPGRTPDRRGP